MMQSVLSKFAQACAGSVYGYDTVPAYYAGIAVQDGDYANAAGWAAWCQPDRASYFDWQVVVLLQIIENERLAVAQ